MSPGFTQKSFRQHLALISRQSSRRNSRLWLRPWLKVALWILLACVSLNSWAWGPTGHRIVGQIASNHLTPKARAKVEQILGGDSLAKVSTWADDMRSNPDNFWQKRSPQWHYINFEQVADFHPEAYTTPSSREQISDVYSAILGAIAALKSKQTTAEDRAFYLRFLVHLVGDVHQPMHAGHAKDRGGNEIQLTFFGRPTNLHSLWDSGLIDSRQLSFSEYASFIDTANPVQIRTWLASSPADWIRESANYSAALYAIPEKNLSYAYVYQQLPLVDLRLAQAGVRLAGLLNQLFDPRVKPGKQALSAPSH